MNLENAMEKYIPMSEDVYNTLLDFIEPQMAQDLGGTPVSVMCELIDDKLIERIKLTDDEAWVTSTFGAKVLICELSRLKWLQQERE